MATRKALIQRHVALLYPFWLRRRRSWISSLGDLSLLTPVPLAGQLRLHMRTPWETAKRRDERRQGQCHHETCSVEREAIWIWPSFLALLPWKSPMTHCRSELQERRAANLGRLCFHQCLSGYLRSELLLGRNAAPLCSDAATTRGVLSCLIIRLGRSWAKIAAWLAHTRPGPLRPVINPGEASAGNHSTPSHGRQG